MKRDVKNPYSKITNNVKNRKNGKIFTFFFAACCSKETARKKDIPTKLDPRGCLLGHLENGTFEWILFLRLLSREVSGKLVCCSNSAWMKGGDPIPWNAFAICETTKTLWQIGKHRRAKHTFRKQWLKSIRFQREINPEFINFSRNQCWESFLVVSSTRGDIWKGDLLTVDLEGSKSWMN